MMNSLDQFQLFMPYRKITVLENSPQGIAGTWFNLRYKTVSFTSKNLNKMERD